MTLFMKQQSISLFTALLALLVFAEAQEERGSRERERKDSGKGGRNGGAGVEAAVTPEYKFNAWLCRPGADSITISVMAWEPMEVFASYGEDEKSLQQRTEPLSLAAGESKSIVLGGLKPDTSYAYQLTTKTTNGEAAVDAVRLRFLYKHLHKTTSAP